MYPAHVAAHAVLRLPRLVASQAQTRHGPGLESRSRSFDSSSLDLVVPREPLAGSREPWGPVPPPL